MRTIIGWILILLLLLMILSCKSQSSIVDNDDMYFQKRDSIAHNRVWQSTEHRTRTWYRVPTYGWYDWGYPYNYFNQFYRPNTIIVIPKSEPQFRYGKRPDREGNGGIAVPLNRRRGRD